MQGSGRKSTGDRAGGSSISSTMLERLKGGDSAAWSRFVSVWGPVVYQWCRRRELQPSDAEDVVQEVFLSAAGHMETFRREKPGDTFRGWLWTITQNKIRNYFSRWNRHPQGAGGTDAQMRLQQLPVPESNEPEGVPDPDSDSLMLHRVLELIRDDFQPNTWQAFWRMVVEGHSAAEIAADLGMTEAAVRQAKRRVLRRLQEELEMLS